MKGRSEEGYEGEGPPCGEYKKSSIQETTCNSGRPLSSEKCKEESSICIVVFLFNSALHIQERWFNLKVNCGPVPYLCYLKN